MLLNLLIMLYNVRKKIIEKPYNFNLGAACMDHLHENFMLSIFISSNPHKHDNFVKLK